MSKINIYINYLNDTAVLEVFDYVSLNSIKEISKSIFDIRGNCKLIYNKVIDLKGKENSSIRDLFGNTDVFSLDLVRDNSNNSASTDFSSLKAGNGSTIKQRLRSLAMKQQKTNDSEFMCSCKKNFIKFYCRICLTFYCDSCMNLKNHKNHNKIELKIENIKASIHEYLNIQMQIVNDISKDFTEFVMNSSHSELLNEKDKSEKSKKENEEEENEEDEESEYSDYDIKKKRTKIRTIRKLINSLNTLHNRYISEVDEMNISENCSKLILLTTSSAYYSRIGMLERSLDYLRKENDKLKNFENNDSGSEEDTKRSKNTSKYNLEKNLKSLIKENNFNNQIKTINQKLYENSVKNTDNENKDLFDLTEHIHSKNFKNLLDENSKKGSRYNSEEKEIKIKKINEKSNNDKSLKFFNSLKSKNVNIVNCDINSDGLTKGLLNVYKINKETKIKDYKNKQLENLMKFKNEIGFGKPKVKEKINKTFSETHYSANSSKLSANFNNNLKRDKEKNKKILDSFKMQNRETLEKRARMNKSKLMEVNSNDDNKTENTSSYNDMTSMNKKMSQKKFKEFEDFRNKMKNSNKNVDNKRKVNASKNKNVSNSQMKSRKTKNDLIDKFKKTNMSKDKRNKRSKFFNIFRN